MTPTTRHAQMELKQFDNVLGLLAARHWSLFVASESAGDFATSDHPVCLLPTDEKLVNRPLGLGLKSTVVLFPLGRKCLLFGSFDGAPPRVEVGRFDVATLNCGIIQCAQSQVYAADDTFPHLLGSQLGTGRTLLKELELGATDTEMRSR